MIRVSELYSSYKQGEKLRRIAIIDQGDLYTFPSSSDLWHPYKLRVVKTWLLDDGILFIELKGDKNDQM